MGMFLETASALQDRDLLKEPGPLMKYRIKYLQEIQDEWYRTILFQLLHYCTVTTVLLQYCSTQTWNTGFFKYIFITYRLMCLSP